MRGPAQLIPLVRRINDLTRSTIIQPYYIDHSNGGYQLERSVDGGGCVIILHRGSPRDLAERMRAWIDGYIAATIKYQP